VKPIKPAPKTAALKVARVKPAPVTTEPITDEGADMAEKLGPIKFDTRPLVMPTRPQNDDDADGDPAVSASLLAGPRNVKPYIARRGEQYMNKEQLEHFARILRNWKRDLMVEVDRTVLHMKDEAANFPDPNDRATQEEEFSLELRTRDRERKLIRKIDEALKRIEDGSYGYCLETGEEIGIKRLEARPVATLSVEAQERRERREKQYGDRDDRYR
jgi:DnaK suppressor protein